MFWLDDHVSLLDLHLQLLNLCSKSVACVCVSVGIGFKVVSWLSEHVSLLNLHLQLLNLCSKSVACVCVCWYRFKVGTRLCFGWMSMFLCWTSTSSSSISVACVFVVVLGTRLFFWFDDHTSTSSSSISVACVVVFVGVGFLHPIDNQIM